MSALTQALLHALAPKIPPPQENTVASLVQEACRSYHISYRCREGPIHVPCERAQAARPLSSSLAYELSQADGTRPM
jgi:hypothetical protein